MRSQPHWVSDDVVLAVHRRQIAEHGGLDTLRDKGLLDSALARPKDLFAYQENVDLFTLAAAYGYGIVRNHPFIDGNKRTGYIIMRLFLACNGVDIDASGEEKYVIMMKLASGSLTEEELSQWLRNHRSL